MLIRMDAGVVLISGCISPLALGLELEPRGVVFQLSDPAVATSLGDSCTFSDPALNNVLNAQRGGSIRHIRTPHNSTADLFSMPVGSQSSVTAAIQTLSALESVTRVEANLYYGSDQSEPEWPPSDFYFSTDYWPYAPFDDLATHPPRWEYSWSTCELDYSTFTYPESVEGNPLGLVDNWHLAMTQTDLAWLVERGDHSVVVAIVDTGVDWEHPDLGANIWQNLGEDSNGNGYVIHQPTSATEPNLNLWEFDTADTLDAFNGDASLCDTFTNDLVGWRFHSPLWGTEPTLSRLNPNHGICVAGHSGYLNATGGYQAPHGTQMASFIGAVHNGFGCVGVCPDVSMMALNGGATFDDEDTPTRHFIGTDEMIEAISYAICKGADIINISLSVDANLYPYPQFLFDVLQDAYLAEIIVCCSAGNKNTDAHRYPAAFGNVLTTAVVRPDSVKMSESSFNQYVDFCAPSGDEAVTAFDGTAIMAAAKWSPPEPLWPDLVPPHAIIDDDTLETGSVHTYKQLNGATSGGAAQLSGAFALLKAHYPNHSRQELIDEMIRGAVDVDPFQINPDVVGKLGHGLINPYRSLTEWGGPRESEIAAGNVTWSGEVWISGDYETPAGCTLTIDPGTTVHIAGFDNETPADDSIDIIADQIYAIGSPSDSILFRSYGPSAEPYAWSLATREGSESVVQMRYCDFQGLWDFKATGSTTAVDSSFISNSSFLDPTSGALQALELKDIHLTQCEFGPKWTLLPADSVRIEWCKIEHDPSWPEFMPAILINGSVDGRFFIENSIIRDSRNAIRFNCTGGDTLTLSNVLIEHAYEAGVQDRGETGINIVSGKVRADHLTLSGYTLGISTEDESKFSAEYSSFTDCYQAALNNPGDFVMFLGYYVQPGNHPLNSGGYNIFEDNERQNIVNLHSTGTISARHNWWGSASSPPPKSNRGRVDTLHHLLVAPNLPPPPNFAEMVDEAAPAFAVGRNFPNPFNPVTKFTFTIPSGGGKLRATVYDIRGRRVRNLADSYLGSGEHSIEFDGRDDGGEALSSGMYLCRFNFRDREEIVKATLVK